MMILLDEMELILGLCMGGARILSENFYCSFARSCGLRQYSSIVLHGVFYFPG